MSNFMLTSDFENDKNAMDLFFKSFDEKFHTYIFFDEELRFVVNDLKNSSNENVKKNLIRFKSQMNELKSRLDFCYSSLLFSSSFIFLVAILVILIKNFSKTIEIQKIKTAEETQKRISMDLHDSVAQDLATLKVNLETGNTENADFLVNQAISEVRFIINSTRVDFDDFEGTLKKMFESFEHYFKIKTKYFIVSDFIEKIDYETKFELYRIFQESLNNIAKHSKADCVVIKIIDLANDFRISIKDNGIGLKKEDFEKENHYGLANIKDRVQKIGGGKVDFINDGGTEIAIKFENIIR